MGPANLHDPGPLTPPTYEVNSAEGAAAFGFPGAGAADAAAAGLPAGAAGAGGATEPAGAGGANPPAAGAGGFAFPPGPAGPMPMPMPGVGQPPPARHTSFREGLPRVSWVGSYVLICYIVLAGDSVRQDPLRFVNEACAGKAVVSAIGGGVLGVPMGVLISADQGLSPPVVLPGQPEPPKIPLKYQLRDSALSTKVKCIRWSKNFAVVTAVFSGVECTIEKVRAKHDVVNSVAAGCVTGAALAAKQGPGAMALGCGGFAVFSYIIDKVMGTH